MWNNDISSMCNDDNKVLMKMKLMIMIINNMNNVVLMIEMKNY